MSKWLIAALLLAVRFGVAGAQLAQTHAGGSAVPLVTYTGVGDIVSGWYGFWSLRAYNAAYATGSNNSINIRRASDGTSRNIVILSNGNLDTSTASTFCASTTCFITEMYDQTGNGRHMVQATAAKQPQLVFNCVNTSLACVKFDGSATILAMNASVNLSTFPLSATVVSIRSSGSSVASQIEMPHAFSLAYQNATQGSLYCGAATGSFTASIGSWLPYQSYCSSSGTDSININGTENSGSWGSTGDGASYTPAMGADPFPTFFLNGEETEGGILQQSTTSTQRNNICHNQSVYWAAGSC